MTECNRNLLVGQSPPAVGKTPMGKTPVGKTPVGKTPVGKTPPLIEGELLSHGLSSSASYLSGYDSGVCLMLYIVLSCILTIQYHHIYFNFIHVNNYYTVNILK